MYIIIKHLLKKIICFFYILSTNSRIKSYLPFSVKIGKGVLIGANVEIFRNLRYIGDYTFIHSNVNIDYVKKIGSFCSISRGTKIGLGAHPKDFLSTSPVFYDTYRKYVVKKTFDTVTVKGETIIGNDVLISANACILAGLKIGTGCIIGAGAIVTKDVPDYAIVVGVPAKIVGFRFPPNIIVELLESRWWEKPLAEARKISEEFNSKYSQDFII